MTLQAIETQYSGCRFRSRLEARWAVFFDTLGIPWEYEPQGYLIGPEDNRRPYLPDFYLPGIGTWVEVKGDPMGLDRNLMAAAVDPKTGLGRCNPFYETTILILGQIPKPGVAYTHWLVSRLPFSNCDRYCGCVDVQYTRVAFLAMPRVITPEMADAAMLDHKRAKDLAGLGALLHQSGRSLLTPDTADLTKAEPTGLLPLDPGVDEAYRAARSARFEHGETP
ncbi:hypothetical protein [Microbispora sp. KK1-11]|uniref:hypothetical protein n=1 Tax=Microbispora sp. KK1-11 TaxID=2053005 RepID=UPI001158C45A|nr:hypothetical protein [Microbispora sp. KK1-11]TQS30021.1 hypothetical protein FLW16_06575 [Microbispora sp. KK1-11]